MHYAAFINVPTCMRNCCTTRLTKAVPSSPPCARLPVPCLDVGGGAACTFTCGSADGSPGTSPAFLHASLYHGSCRGICCCMPLAVFCYRAATLCLSFTLSRCGNVSGQVNERSILSLRAFLTFAVRLRLCGGWKERTPPFTLSRDV